MALRQADRLESNNPRAYGVVRAVEVAGHKSVKNLDELYSIADCILSDSKINENNDAIGQTWYVIDSSCGYRLIDWETRNESAGWRRIDTADNVDSVISQVNSNTEAIGIINGSGTGSITKAIADLKAELSGEVSESFDNLKKIEDQINLLKDSLTGGGIKTITPGDRIEISEITDEGEITISAISEIDDTTEEIVNNRTWSIKKLKETLKVVNAVNGSGTTVENTSGVVKINISVDDESLKLNDSGKLSVNMVDGGTY